jgi:transcriptional regulator with XRE-family HTH domain
MDMSVSASLLKEARRQAGLTQAQLALRLGVSQAAVAKLERPDANPRIATLEDVLRMTGRRLVLATELMEVDIGETLVAEQLKLSPGQRLARLERMYEWVHELEITEGPSRGQPTDIESLEIARRRKRSNPRPSGQTEPGQTEPGQTEPGQTEPGQTEPGQTEPGQTEPGQTEPG